MSTIEIESLISRVREFRKVESIGRKRINATPEIRSICLKIVNQIGVLKAAEKTGFSVGTLCAWGKTVSNSVENTESNFVSYKVPTQQSTGVTIETPSGWKVRFDAGTPITTILNYMKSMENA